MKTYKGNLIINENNQDDYKDLVEVTGYLHIYSQAKLDSLKTVGGYLYIYSQTKFSPNVLKLKYERYYINDVNFDKELFLKVWNDKLSAQEVFSLTNIEQRRVAYELMDKAKMAELPDLRVLDEVKDDGYGYLMKVIEFSSDDYDEPFRFLNCFCPSTGREYYLETKQKTCKKAKAMSFGLPSLKINKEW